jgi:hypothetical protein
MYQTIANYPRTTLHSIENQKHFLIESKAFSNKEKEEIFEIYESQINHINNIEVVDYEIIKPKTNEHHPIY